MAGDMRSCAASETLGRLRIVQQVARNLTYVDCTEQRSVWTLLLSYKCILRTNPHLDIGMKAMRRLSICCNIQMSCALLPPGACA